MESLFIEPFFMESVPVDELFVGFLCFIEVVPLFFMLSLDIESFCIELLLVGDAVEPEAVDCAKAAPVESRQPMASEAIKVFVVRIFVSSSIDARK